MPGPEEADQGAEGLVALAALELVQLVHELDRAHLPPPAVEPISEPREPPRLSSGSECSRG
jgi:hypothetical protein